MKLLATFLLAAATLPAVAQQQTFWQAVCNGTERPAGVREFDDVCGLYENGRYQAVRNQLAKMVVANRRHGNPRLLYLDPTLWHDAVQTEPVELLRPWMREEGGWVVHRIDHTYRFNGFVLAFGRPGTDTYGFQLDVVEQLYGYAHLHPPWRPQLYLDGVRQHLEDEELPETAAEAKVYLESLLDCMGELAPEARDSVYEHRWNPDFTTRWLGSTGAQFRTFCNR